jgi:general secretion pathway protein B
MSFILDALKKSEAERQRHTGPTLLELRVTRPPRRYPLWSLVVGVLLAVNVAVLLTFLLRRPPPAAAGAAAPASTASQIQARTPAAVPLAATTPQVRPAPAAPVAPAAAPAQPVPALADRSAPGPASSATSGTGTSSADGVLITPAGVVGGAAREPPPAPTDSVADADAAAPARNPADYEPALPPGTRQSGPAPQAAAQPAATADYSNLPSLSQISGNIPAMRLDLLDYSQLASERYALINMQRVREGDVLPNGAHVLAITPNGVAVDYRGLQFLLRPGGTAQ